MRTTTSLAVVYATLTLAGCNGSETQPSNPQSSVTLNQQFPPSGSTIVVQQGTGTPPQSFIVRGSGQLGFDLTVTSGRFSPWAQLYVYLLTADAGPLNYCGQNLPDAPTWGPFNAGQTVNVTITGFQVFRLPCDVTGIHVMLHLRNSGLLTPPTPSETLAEGTFPVSYHLTP